jgi:glycosyltransferase involved in cell wall biosynthesis
MNPNLFIAAGIFHPEAGGPATYLHEILPALQQKGWTPQVLTYGDSPTVGYPYPLKRIPRRFLPLRLANYWLASRSLAAQADLIYAHTIDLPVAWGKKPRLIKIVGDQAWERCIRKNWIAPTTDIDTFQTSDFGSIVSRQKDSRAKQVQAFDAVIVPSHYLKNMVIDWGIPENKIHVIYNAMPPMPAKKYPNQAAAREALGWDSRPVILTAARLNPWKGIDHLIAAIRDLPDARLLVAGDGEDMPRLKNLAEPLGDRVQLLGHVPRETLYGMMQAADYFALYSGYEGLAHTLLEALRLGTPVIASAKGGNPEVVQEGVNGLLAPYVDVDALREVLRRALTMRDDLAANTQIGMERFAFSTMVDETDRVLRGYL